MIIDLETLERLNRAESERDALKAEVERLMPLMFRPAPCHAACEATAFNIEIRKLKAELEALGHRFNDVSIALSVANKECTILSSEKAALSAQLEAARKQEPVGYFYLLDFSDATIYQDKFGDDNFSPLYASPVLAHKSEALEVLSSAIDTLKTVAGNCEWSHSDFPVIARAEKLLQETPCTE